MRADSHVAERFSALHDTADTLLDELTERYTVERRELKELLRPEQAMVRMVRLIPRTPAAGPLAIAFTELPGLIVRLGRWWVDVLPESRFDDPVDLEHRLREHVYALVEGGLWERVRRSVSGSRFEVRLIGEGVDEARTGPLTTAEARDARQGGFAVPVQWAPWPTRP